MLRAPIFSYWAGLDLGPKVYFVVGLGLGPFTYWAQTWAQVNLAR